MNISKLFLIVSLIVAPICLCMELDQGPTLSESDNYSSVISMLETVSKTAEPVDKECIIKIMSERFHAIEAFAGILTQLRYAYVQNRLQRDKWAESLVSAITCLEMLDSQASEKVKEFFKAFDELCAQNEGYTYQRIAPLLYSYYGNAKAWDTYLKSAILYQRAVLNLYNRITKSFLALGLEGARKRPFLSNLKKIIDTIKGNTIPIFEQLDTTFSFNDLFLFAQNEQIFEYSCSIARNHVSYLQSDQEVYNTFETHCKLANASTEEDCIYYKELCQLDNNHRKLLLEAQDVLHHISDFKKLLERMKLYSSSLLSSFKVRTIYKAACTLLTPNPESALKVSTSETELGEYIATHRDSLDSMIKHHLTIACNFHYLNQVYQAIEELLPALPLQQIQNKLNTLLAELRSIMLTKESSEKKGALESIQHRVRTLKSMRDTLNTELWKLVQRLCSKQWNSFIEASKACLANLTMNMFVYRNFYILLKQPVIAYNNPFHSHPELTKECSTIFGDQAKHIIILKTYMIPYIAEVYKERTQGACLLHPIELSAEKKKSIQDIVIRILQKKATKHVKTSQNPTQQQPLSLESESNEYEEAELEEEKEQELTTITPIKLHAISYEEHQRLKELTRKLFIPTLSKIKETDAFVILRAWRGYSSDENTTITLHKVRTTAKCPPECIIIVDPRILKKVRDQATSNWDRYHTFSFEIERNYLSSCSLIVNASDTLAKQLRLNIDEQSYALCIQARIGSQDGYIVYLVKKASRICYHRFFHKLQG